MTLLVIGAVLCYLLGQVKAETSTVRMVIAVGTIALWLLHCLGLLHLPECLGG